MPQVFRRAGILLLPSLVAGQFWQHQPAGATTRHLLKLVERRCPSAVRRAAEPTVADGAHALDRWTLRLIATRLDRVPRCNPAGLDTVVKS